MTCKISRLSDIHLAGHTSPFAISFQKPACDCSFDRELATMAANETASFAAILQKYDQFVNEKLKPDLKATLDARDALYDLTSE